jgi:hypothetical protein
LVSDEALALAIGPLGIFVLGCRDRHHLAVITLTAQPADKGTFEQLGVEMAEDAAKLESRPPESKRKEGTDLAPTREIDPQSQREDGKPELPEATEVQKLSVPLPRRSFIPVGLIVVAFAGWVLYIIFGPRADVRTADAYVTVHYSAIAPRISGQVATVPVDDNETVRAGQVLATLDPRDNETALASAEAAVARDRSQLEDRDRVAPAVSASSYWRRESKTPKAPSAKPCEKVAM